MFDHPQNISFVPTCQDRTMETNMSITETINVSTTDPSHLFWVPASYHPEIAPAEFEKHVLALRTTVMDDDKVKRRRSALSVSFTANDGDMYQNSNKSQATSSERGQAGNHLQTDSSFSDDSKTTMNDTGEQENVLQHSLNNMHRQQHQQQALSSLNRSNSLHSLTNFAGDDQQIKGTPSAKVAKPTENDDEHPNNHHITLETQALKGKIRRSMSVQLPDNTADPGKIPDFLVFDRHSAILDQSSVLVSKTNRPLSRRGARTKFRKTSTTTLSSLKPTDIPPLPQQWSTESLPDATSTVIDTNDISEFDENGKDSATATIDNQQYQSPKMRHSEDPEMDAGVTSSIATVTSIQHSTTNDQNFNASSTHLDSPTAQQPSPSLHPTAIPTKTDTNLRPLSELPVILQQSTTSTSPPRERKSSWSWSFWSDGDKKTKNDKTATSSTVSTTIIQQIDQKNSDIDNKGSGSTPPLSVTESSTSSTASNKQRFGFSSLFSRKSSPSTPNVDTKSERGKEKSVNSAITIVKAPQKDFQLNRMNHQRRLPIHTERAMYRLSHTKLANSRRPLRDQVIISNFMFWYLSIINNQQQQHQQHQPLVTFPEQDGANNSNNNNTINGTSSSPPRQNMPRTPQQIITGARKKKRMGKKNHQQNHYSTTPTQQQHGGKPTTTTSYQKKRSSSLTSSSGSSQQQSKDKAEQHYIDRSSKTQTSTGFVVPENYLRPTASNGSNKSKPQQRQHPGYTRSNSWSSDDDDDNDDDLDDESDDDDDDHDCTEKDKGNDTHSSQNERVSPPSHHTTTPKHRPLPVSSNYHAYNNQRQQQQHPPEQHYLISASAT